MGFYFEFKPLNIVGIFVLLLGIITGIATSVAEAKESIQRNNIRNKYGRS